MSERKTLKSMCPMNCHPTLCGMVVEVSAVRWSLADLTSSPGGTRSARPSGVCCQPWCVFCEIHGQALYRKEASGM